MDPLVGIGLFVGIPVGLALLIVIAIMVPKRYGGSDPTETATGLITSSAAAPNPVALPGSDGSRVETTGGAHGNW